MLAAVSDSDKVRRWDVASGKEHASSAGALVLPGSLRCMEPGRQDPRCPCLRPKSDGLRLWDVASARSLRDLEDHGSVVAWSPDGKTLASGSHDGQVRLWLIGRGDDRTRARATPSRTRSAVPTRPTPSRREPIPATSSSARRRVTSLLQGRLLELPDRPLRGAASWCRACFRMVMASDPSYLDP